ncbi:cuticle protein AMP2-like [Oratosquilla oratoria]|uniref:cuticle protein AMP2-like n=1 Tax=Oratosquilla oratoria TaxID=337810 RepID=UPI003F75DEEB
MKTQIVFAALLAVAAALPRPDDDSQEAAILSDDRVQPEGGAYSVAFETENGIQVSESASAGEEGQSNSQGVFRFPLDNGEIAEVKWVANEFGFQPESSLLPVAPAFPHPIPEFVLEQIRFAEEQRRNADSDEDK